MLNVWRTAKYSTNIIVLIIEYQVIVILSLLNTQHYNKRRVFEKGDERVVAQIVSVYFEQAQHLNSTFSTDQR